MARCMVDLSTMIPPTVLRRISISPSMEVPMVGLTITTAQEVPCETQVFDLKIFGAQFVLEIEDSFNRRMICFQRI